MRIDSAGRIVGRHRLGAASKTGATTTTSRYPGETMLETNNPIATVQRMFRAFGAGDLDALIATVHPDSRWTYFGANPRLTKANFVGRARVRKFFEGILERLEMTSFNTDEFIVQGDTVVV